LFTPSLLQGTLQQHEGPDPLCTVLLQSHPSASEGRRLEKKKKKKRATKLKALTSLLVTIASCGPSDTPTPGLLRARALAWAMD
jgi:hypothetical protein